MLVSSWQVLRRSMAVGDRAGRAQVAMGFASAFCGFDYRKSEGPSHRHMALFGSGVVRERVVHHSETC